MMKNGVYFIVIALLVAELLKSSHLICINRNLQELGNQECYHNKINAILHRFETSFE